MPEAIRLRYLMSQELEGGGAFLPPNQQRTYQNSPATIGSSLTLHSLWSDLHLLGAKQKFYGKSVVQLSKAYYRNCSNVKSDLKRTFSLMPVNSTIE